MIDHILGRPSPSWKRTQVFLVLLFWTWRLARGNRDGPRILWIRRANRLLARFTPWQIIVGVLSTLYAARHLDSIIGLGSPEPLARLYSRSYYRATWIATGLDAGHATAMNIQPKWLRDLASMLFSVYYIIYANEADEKLRKYRATASIEMLRTTWEKSSKNPWIRALTYPERPGLPVVRKLVFVRPGSDHAITAWLFFSQPAQDLKKQHELILDFPGGGFISMSPLDHEERLRRWALRTGRPVLSVDYHKAPEYPYPFAIDEAYDMYKLLVESRGRIIGMAGTKLGIILTGDSAGANICCNVMFKILETPASIKPLPKPISIVLNYAALDFNFTSWMAPGHLKVLRSQASQGHIPGLEDMKDHFSGQGPLDVADRSSSRGRKSWTGESVKGWTENMNPPSPNMRRRTTPFGSPDGRRAGRKLLWGEPEQYGHEEEEEKPAKLTIGTRLTMTSRTGFFQDRIISPSMMRAMAILYIGPKNNPDFKTDYRISPILAPSTLLADFPTLLMTCGEKDPFVDDTVVFAGRIREAKRMKKREGSRFGEGLRMSRNEREAEDEEWVHMHIFEGWRYLQMAPLMSEARAAIDDIAGWINDAFARAGERDRERERDEEAEVLTFTPRKRRSPPGSVDATRSVVGDGVGAQHPGLGAEPVPAPVNGRGRPSVSMPLASLTEQELMRRRRVEAVVGIGEGTIEGSAVVSDDEREEMRIAYGY
ncbi:carbohydrate esterase family 10 protein [Ceratobasidium sp. AG-Ba]|nr:carbohydrate esterase family 10 protein [Ceratobasidium sp. AG-Ba]QRW08419.1 carbohydrate esterase family 10 protein [Ceratobasidium sp. AG-Ba]